MGWNLYRLLYGVHGVLGRSRLAVRLAARLRKQCEHVIRRHMFVGYDVSQNGEGWLVQIVAPSISRFVDVGANVGDWSVSVLDHASPSARGLLLDPSASAVARLRDRFTDQDRIEIIEAAASESSGEATFFEEPDAGYSSSLGLAFTRSGAVPRLVKVTTLDEEVSQRGWNHVDLVKIDAEGYDLAVIRGARRLLERQAIGLLQFEYQDSWVASGSTLRAALDLLQSCDYRVFLLKGEGLYDFPYLKFGEFFGYSNFVALSKPVFDRLSIFVKGSV